MLEATNMEHTPGAPLGSVVIERDARSGQQTQVEALLARIEEHAGAPA